jgi:predicted small lipoprotein YifL
VRKILSVLLSVIVIFSLSACGAQAKEAVAPDNTAGGQTEQSTTTANKEPENLQLIEVGQTTTIDDYCEFTVTGTKFAKTIEPPSPGEFYTYYESKEAGETYFDTVVSIKSLLTSGKSSDEFASVKVIYGGKYEYKTFATIEDNGGTNFTFTNITSIEPLKSGTLHFIAAVPNEVEKSSDELTVVVSISGKDYHLKIR